MRRAARWQAGRSGGTGRLAASRMDFTPIARSAVRGQDRLSPALVLDGAASVPGRAQAVAEREDGCADAADEEVARAIRVAVDPAPNGRIPDVARGHHLHLEARQLRE